MTTGKRGRQWATLVGVVLASGAISAPADASPLRVLAYRTDAFFFEENGKPAGLEYDILEYFARSQKRPLEVRFVESFGEMLPALERGEADIAAGTITVTAEREARYGFSDSYFPVRVMLVEPKGKISANLGELAGAQLATIPGTTLERLLSAVPRVQFVHCEGQRQLFELVAAGKARALAVDSAVAFSLLPQFPGLQLGIALSEPQNYGFAVAKGSPLLPLLNRHLVQLKASGIYFRLLEKYLGAEAVRTIKSAAD